MSYKVLLKLLTKTFLLDDDLPEFQANRTLQNAIDSHRASFTALQKSLQEAKLEALWNSEMRSCSNEYDAIVKSMQRLAQSVGGLRSSCGLQFERMKEQGKRLETAEELWNIRADHNRRKFEDEIKRERVVKARHEEDVSLIEFIRTIRQPLKSLAYTCKLTIIDLQAEFSNQTHKGPSNETLKNSLVKAIALFEVSQRQAVEKLNRHRKNASFIPKQNVFLVYFFVFNMIEFARELICLVDSAQALCVAKSKRRGVFSLISDVFRYKSKLYSGHLGF
jgi:hypothetical protein